MSGTADEAKVGDWDVDIPLRRFLKLLLLGRDLTNGCEFEVFPAALLSDGWGVWLSLGGLMVTDHVEFGPSAEEVPLLQLTGPSSSLHGKTWPASWITGTMCVCMCLQLDQEASMLKIPLLCSFVLSKITIYRQTTFFFFFKKKGKFPIVLRK